MVKISYTFSFVLIAAVSSLLFTENNSAKGGESRPVERTTSPYTYATTQIDSAFSYFWKKRGFNGNVLVALHDSVIYKNTFGYADLKKKEPLNIQSVFQLASVSKQFTAVAVMMLHERGLIAYEDTIQKFIPEFPYKNITVMELLAHRSGLPNYMYFSGKYWRNKRTFLTNNDVLDMLIQYKPGVEFLPDRRYKYSNTGYAILAIIVERVSGIPFDQFMEQNVFIPLGMHNTFVYNPKSKKTIEYETNGYSRNRRRAYDDFLSGVVGDKGVFSTVDDLFLWDQALYTEKILKQSTLEEAFEPISYDRRRKNNYGFGWRITTLEDGSKIVYHGGWWRGYNSLFVRRLEDHATVIVLANKVNWSFGDINELMALLSPSSF